MRPRAPEVALCCEQCRSTKHLTGRPGVAGTQGGPPAPGDTPRSSQSSSPDFSSNTDRSRDASSAASTEVAVTPSPPAPGVAEGGLVPPPPGFTDLGGPPSSSSSNPPGGGYPAPPAPPVGTRDAETPPVTVSSYQPVSGSPPPGPVPLSAGPSLLGISGGTDDSHPPSGASPLPAGLPNSPSLGAQLVDPGAKFPPDSGAQQIETGAAPRSGPPPGGPGIVASLPALIPYLASLPGLRDGGHAWPPSWSPEGGVTHGDQAPAVRGSAAGAFPPQPVSASGPGSVHQSPEGSSSVVPPVPQQAVPPTWQAGQAPSFPPDQAFAISPPSFPPGPNLVLPGVASYPSVPSPQDPAGTSADAHPSSSSRVTGASTAIAPQAPAPSDASSIGASHAFPIAQAPADERTWSILGVPPVPAGPLPPKGPMADAFSPPPSPGTPLDAGADTASVAGAAAGPQGPPRWSPEASFLGVPATSKEAWSPQANGVLGAAQPPLQVTVASEAPGEACASPVFVRCVRLCVGRVSVRVRRQICFVRFQLVVSHP